MTAGSKQRQRSIFSRLKRGQDTLEIADYRVGDIHAEHPVSISAEGTLVGNLFAPQVTITGLMCGPVVAQEVTIKPGGQVWGDVFAIGIHVQPGGKLLGWMTTLAEMDYEAILESGEVPGTFILEPPEALADAELQEQSRQRLNVLRNLREEAAAAVAARDQLQRAFDERLSGMAGEAIAKADTLAQALEKAEEQVSTLQGRTDELEQTLGKIEAKLEEKKQALSDTREALRERDRQLNELRLSFEQQVTAFEELHQAKTEVDEYLEDALEQLKTQSDRAYTLELALEESMQRTSDHETSLFHWQELAGVTGARVQKLEHEVERLQQQLDESRRMVEIHREKRLRAEEAWAQATAVINGITSPSEKADAPSESGISHVAELRQALAAAELRTQELEEQLAWQKANAQAAALELEQARHLTEEHQAMQDKLTALELQMAAERNSLEDQLRHIRLQSAAFESEVDYHLKQTEQQGQRLAELQALLVERDLQLGDAKAIARKQAALIQQLKQVTGARIRALEKQLAQSSLESPKRTS
ncbi:MAG: polymer-forming cytoskeletal protein [Anaerolineae bacterium]